MMWAWKYMRPGPAREVLELVEMPRPKPGPGQVRVALAASGVNPHDTKKRSGWLGPAAIPDAGFVPHSDGAGIIDAVGAGVSRSRIGERVFVLRAPEGCGTAAEYVAIDQGWAVALPDGVSFAEGACIGVPAFTAWLAVLRDGPVTGRTVLVHGAGAVGRIAIELAAWNGADVIATAGGEASRAAAKARGARIVIDRHHQDIAAEVAALSGGRGVDRVVDVDFGANGPLDAEILADHGTVASYSATSDPQPILPYYAFAAKGARLSFVQCSKLTPRDRDDAARVICTLLAQGRLRPDIAQRHEFADAPAAHEAVESGPGGNVVLEVGAANE